MDWKNWPLVALYAFAKNHLILERPMVDRLIEILAEFDFIPSRLLRVTAFYLLSCMLKGGKRGYSEMSKLFGLSASNFMRFIGRDGAVN